MNELTKALEKTGNNQSELSRRLGVAVSKVNDYIAGRRAIPPWVAGRAAEIAGEDPELAELEALMAQARTDRERSYWSERLKQLRGAAAGMVLAAVVAGAALSPATAEAYKAPSMKSHAALRLTECPNLYILRTFKSGSVRRHSAYPFRRMVSA